MIDKVMKAKVRELLKDCHPTYTEKDGTVSVCSLDENLMIDKLTIALSQAQAEAREEVGQYILDNHDYGAIPETNEYANGWNDSRKRAYQQLKYLLFHLSYLTVDEKETDKRNAIKEAKRLLDEYKVNYEIFK